MTIEIELQDLNSNPNLNQIEMASKPVPSTSEIMVEVTIEKELQDLNSNPNLNEENVVEMMSKIVPSQGEDSSDVNYQWYSVYGPGIFFVPCTLLHIAARFNCDRIASFLIERGAKVDLRDILGSETPLHYAVKYGDNIKVVKILIAAEANVNAQERCGTEPYYALKNNVLGGKTPLHYAAINDNMEVAKVLIAAGANVNAQECCGTEPLYYALKNNYMRTAKFLIDNGADLPIQTHIIQKAKDERINTFDIIISTAFVVTLSILLYTTESPTFTMIGAIASALTTGGIIYKLESMCSKHERNSKLDEVECDDATPLSPQPA
ncbi:ankyrin repeat domain-containing protein [Wolbachia endosymbiont of Pentalonia nigronervosa]|jgi:hypothetical protein|uniref:ankyrin repeat domain-containing protein n=1 Tax=Wolbachia endosymbiont of Pentalonia nigronervosa TaxID=1301914 RepID=UPI00165ED2B2|nr:ankyrin repeat domain-containing protein [Wolbachia endosymbiont of Pentalonia nigronervosa]MBD0391771.1 ankyrin repeat domain-containing protein [Wolbachia endosymbiont of Pentalonia nigronervosa]